MGKAKEIVKTRFNSLKNGGRSIYFDIYMNGSRRYLFQKERLLPETDENTIQANSRTLEVIENRRRRLIAELILDKSEISDRSFNTDVRLVDWMDRHFKVVMRTATASYIGNFNTTRRFIEEFRPGMLIRDVDDEFVAGLHKFIVSHPHKRNPKRTVAPSAAYVYLKLLSAHLNAAIRARLIDRNPCPRLLAILRKPFRHRTSIHALTRAELDRLINKPCARADVKRTFLFSCFTGIMPVDLYGIQWRHLYRKDGRIWLSLHLKRTDKSIELPLNDMAIASLPPRRRAKRTAQVFNYHSRLYFRTHLRKWAKDAKVDSVLDFQTAKDTYASLLLAVGTDFYTASYMMGFTYIDNMYEYEGMVNEKRRDVVERIDKAINA